MSCLSVERPVKRQEKVKGRLTNSHPVKLGFRIRYCLCDGLSWVYLRLIISEDLPRFHKRRHHF